MEKKKKIIVPICKYSVKEFLGVLGVQCIKLCLLIVVRNWQLLVYLYKCYTVASAIDVTLGKKSTVHQVTTMLSTSKNVLFP